MATVNGPCYAGRPNHNDEAHRFFLFFLNKNMKIIMNFFLIKKIKKKNNNILFDYPSRHAYKRKIFIRDSY